MSKHTPGPWYAGNDGIISRRNPNELYQNRGEIAGEIELAQAFKGWDGEKYVGYPVEANARLMAAAPELLEALKNLYRMVQGECPSLLEEDSGGSAHLDILISAAIAKAEGGQA